MKETCLILHANKWDLVDENTGEKRDGTTIYYCSADYMDNGTRRGPQVFKESGPVEMFDQLAVLPGVYDVSFTTSNSNDRNGRPKRTLKPQMATFVDELDLSSLLGASELTATGA